VTQTGQELDPNNKWLDDINAECFDLRITLYGAIHNLLNTEADHRNDFALVAEALSQLRKSQTAIRGQNTSYAKLRFSDHVVPNYCL